MNLNEFHSILNRALSFVENKAKITPEYYTESGGENFEPKVVKAIEFALSELCIDAKVIHIQGGHAFPDIVLECPDGKNYGVEVKSTKSNQWKINGNSVVGSTSADNIIETYIFFGKLIKGNPEFKIRKYEECISDVAVTHSPRYKIDMELPVGETFFDKALIAYKDIKNSNDPISLVKEYYKKQGSTAWWLTESAPPVIRILNELPTDKRSKYLSYGFAYFPEILSTAQHKYHNFAIWLISEHSMVATNIRDFFSASGQVKMTLNGHTYEHLPKVYENLRKCKANIIDIITSTPAAILRSKWKRDKGFGESGKDKIAMWLYLVTSNELQNNKNGSINTIQLVNDIFNEYL